MLGVVRFELLLGILLFLSLILTTEEDKWRSATEPARRIYIFFLYVLLSLPVVTWPGSVLRFHLEEWLKVIFFFVCVVAAVRTVSQLKWFITVFLGCQVVRILEPLYLHITTGYWGDRAYSTVGGTLSGLNRLGGAPHDIVNSNQLAWVVVNTVPFFYYLLWGGGKLGKMMFLLAMPPFIYCMLLTGSRSGLLSLSFAVLAMVWLSRHRVRNLVIVMVMILPLAGYVMSHLSTDLQTRYLSLIDDSVPGADTAHKRVGAVINGIRSISNNPLFGNGLGTSKETNVNVLGGKAGITHNLYLEVFQEMGLIGFVLFMLYIVSIISCLKKARKLLEDQGLERTWLYRTATATFAWVAMDLFYSLSCFGLRSWEWYFFGAVSTLCLVFAEEGVAGNVVAKGNLVSASPILKESDYH